MDEELPNAYLIAKLKMVMPLFQEARDALTAIRETQRVLHGISATLADRMDEAGTFSLEDWNRRAPAQPEPSAPLCRTDGRCQYAIDHGAEGLGHCPAGKCVMPAAAPTVVEPVAWAGYDLDGMVEAFHRVIEAHANKNNPFHNPIDADAQMALRILRGFVPAMKAYAATPPRAAREQQTQKSINLLRSALLRIEQAQSIHTAHALAESALRKWRSQNGEGHENCDV